MTDMDEIRELLSEYADAVFDRGAASGASNEVYPPNAGETSSRSALLQRVEALREAMYEARADAALNRAKYEGAVSAIPVVVAKETERLTARAEAAESALAALRAAPRGCTACGSGFRNVEEWRAALAPAPPAALRPPTSVLEKAKAAIEAVAEQVEHAEDCPQDDTCVCPVVALVNEAHRELVEALRPPENKEDPTP